MRSLDRTDRRILLELDRNSRNSYSLLSKKLRIEPAAICSRVERLSGEGVIERFFTLIDVCRTGYSMYKVLLKLQFGSRPEIQALIDYLHSQDSVIWLVELEGKYDLGFVVRFRKITELDHFIRQVAGRFNHCIARRVFSVNIFGEYLSRTSLVGKSHRKNPSLTYFAGGDEYPLDSLSLEILRTLADNSRTAVGTIADRLSPRVDLPMMAPDAVRHRIERLESERVITGYSIVINNERIDRFRFKVLLYLNEAGDRTLDTFVQYCRTLGSIVYIVKSLGEWDYELDLEVDEIGQCRETIVEIVQKFPDLIRDHAALLIRKQLKFTFSP